MDTPEEFQVKTASSSDTGILTAAAASTAASGAHQVLVNQLAQNAVQAHQGVSAATTLINASGADRVFAFSYAGGPSVSLRVANGATLADLAAAINAGSATSGVSASVLDLGAAAGATRFRLMLQGKDTGAVYNIAVDDALTTLDGSGGALDFRSAAFSQTQAPQNARLRVDGFPPDA